MEMNEKVQLFRSKFAGRQDVYGVRWEVVSREDNKTIGGYAPVCGNIWKDFCHLKLKDGVSCPKCEHRQWASVTDESVKKHLVGQEAQLNYLLLQDGTINFGAMDFDMKEGKEEKGYSFEDVRKVADLLLSYGIKFGIARSTGKGFHLYIFFDKPYSATKFRSFILELYNRVGFMAYVHQGIKAIPEYFPKQAYVGKDGIGNGIKPPMIEPRFEKLRNGWTDLNNNFIGQDLPVDARIDAQWEYFKNIPLQSTDEFDLLFDTQDIPFMEELAPGDKRSGTPRSVYDKQGYGSKWQPPISGSIEKVLEGCKAFREIKAKVCSGAVLGHEEGFALYHLCMHTLDGLDWFKINVKGWGQNDKELRQLEQSVEKNYLPWTCKTLQDKGVCKPGTQCFEKRPPREIVDGTEILRDDLPKDKWPEPSPIRYAHGKGDDYLLRLFAELLEVKNIKSQEERYEAVKKLALRSQVFDEGQQKEFKNKVREEKPLKRNEISKIFNEAADTFEEDVRNKIEKREDSVKCDDNLYLKDAYGYTYVKAVKDGKTKNIKICSVDIIIQEKKTYHDGDNDVQGFDQKIVYSGICRAPGFEKKFSIGYADWFDNQKFLVYFGGLFDHAFCPLRQNIEYIRQAVELYSREAGIEKTTVYTIQGYSGDTYRMPSCLIDATGIRPNTTQQVDLSNKETRGIDFQILSDSELKEVLLHIKTDFLTTWPESWTYIGLAQILYPAVMGPMGWHKKPTLFYEGLTGGGKSELTHALQHFWGNFPALANFMSSPKGIRDLGHHFKDACVVIDDFKNLSRDQTASVRETILHAYDGAVENKLKRDGNARPPKSARGTYMMSGEEFITNDAAVIARTILVETKKHNTRNTQRKYEKVMAMRRLYNGVTPHFIRWFLTQDRAGIAELVSTIKGNLRENYEDAQNIDRVTNNLAHNHVLWCLFTSFLVEYNVSSAAEKDQMDTKHWGFIQHLLVKMVERCAAEQSSEAFLRMLNQMIIAGEVNVDKLPGCNGGNKPLVGYIPSTGVDIIHIFPKIAFKVVIEYASKGTPIYGTEKALTRQLQDQGALAEIGEDSLTKNVRYNGKQVRVWVLKLSSLGLDQENDDVVSTGTGKVYPMTGIPLNRSIYSVRMDKNDRDDSKLSLVEDPFKEDDNGLV